jgi:thiosulfate/3-mercaptopyruvate sulfurtransferase
VIYDDKQAGNAAARFWWMLKAIGHAKRSSVKWRLAICESSRLSMSAKKCRHKPQSNYPARLEIANGCLEEVKSSFEQNNATIVDVRSSERFDGITEPIDLIAGHIPGAVNIPFTTNLNAARRILIAQRIERKIHEGI